MEGGVGHPLGLDNLDATGEDPGLRGAPPQMSEHVLSESQELGSPGAALGSECPSPVLTFCPSLIYHSCLSPEPE